MKFAPLITSAIRSTRSFASTAPFFRGQRELEKHAALLNSQHAQQPLEYLHLKGDLMMQESPEFFKYLKSNSSLSSFKINSPLLASEGLANLMLYLPKTLTEIEISSQNIDYAGWDAFSDFIKNSIALSKVSLHHSKIDPEVLGKIVTCTTASSLNFNDVSFPGDKKTQSLVGNLRNRSMIYNLDQDGRFGSVIRELQFDSHLKSLFVANTGIGERGLDSVAELIAKTKSLEHLDLSRHEEVGRHLVSLAPSLSKNTTLTKINLSDTNITEEGIQTLHDVFTTDYHGNLKDVVLGYLPKLSDKSISLLSEMHKSCPNIDFWCTMGHAHGPQLKAVKGKSKELELR